MGIADSMKKAAFSTAFSYIGKNPEENAPKLMAWVDKFAGEGPDSFPAQRAAIRNVINDKNNNMHQLVMDIMKDTDPDVLKATFMNFFLNANIIGWPKQEQNRKKYNCNIPWAILLDPTSACNLHCTGCWAAEYGNRLNLTFDEIDSIVTQGKQLGVYMYIYTGGEPLVRKKDLIAICNKHSDCQFLSFTNGTLIDEEFADEMLRVKNFIPAISLEGFEAATDGRRGNGVFEKATHAMKLLQAKHLPFGISACYTSANIDSIASDAYIDYICSLGARFIWYFHYMPVGNDAAPQLLPNPEQREYIHYSNANIRNCTLLEALQSPIFMAYHDGQPFNDNHLRPCPMLENPQILREIVEKTGAHSTDPQSPETADHLCAKCDEYAKNWQPTAERLWACSHDCSTCGAGCGKKD